MKSRDALDRLLEGETKGLNLYPVFQAAKSIRHCGDYGKLFYNASTKTLWWTMADSDGSDEYDTADEIRAKFMACKGVRDVEIGDEHSPRDPGWKELSYRD